MKIHLALVCLLLCAAPAVAQEPTLDEKSKERLEWLKQFVGEWEVEHEGVGNGKMSCTMLGDHWMVNDMTMEGSGFKVRGLQTIGYDVEKEKYVGTWVDSMNGFMWHYEGDLDEDGKKIVLQADGPSMTNPNEMATYRDVYEFADENNIIASALILGDDGEWTAIMNGTARRVSDE